MRKDIVFPKIEHVYIAVAKDDEQWKVYLINRGKDLLENIMITSKGYGMKDCVEQRTSILRHMIPHLDKGEYGLIEPIDEQVFHLNNEYWVSFFIGGQVYDKKYIFVPESILGEHLSFIPELKMKGVMHQ